MIDMEKETDRTGLEIAVIGMSGRFPGARNVGELWRNLRDGVEALSSFPEEDLIASDVSPDQFNDPAYVRTRGILEDIDLFDASFFGLAPHDARIMDPQHRIFLECASEALDHAGYDPDRYKGAIGVFAGVGESAYVLFNLYSNKQLFESIDPYHLFITNHKDSLTMRVCYKLNLRGPGVVIQTACSTSLVAVHLACQSLLSGECDIALAGGVMIAVPQKRGYVFQEGGILSPDGHCRAFDALAQGTVGGNGVGIVVLKKLDQALACGDSIDAVIKGSAINNDGAMKVSYTAPSVDAQADVISMALGVAGVLPDTISYVEAHGTGTALGDPIEIAALTQAFRAGTDRKNFCGVGSLKTNVGHMGTAAGIGGLIKTVLALKHRQIPPSLHFERPNPRIDWANCPFYVVDKLTEWKSGQSPRRAGVSSFGIGGTNAHVVLEEAPAVERSAPSRFSHLLTLSAKTESALETATTNLAAHLKAHPELDLADVAYTLQIGRRSFEHRRTLVSGNLADAASWLEERNPEQVFTHYQEDGDRPVLFMFPGQGSQYVNMGADLYQEEPLFKAEVDRCAEILRPHLGFDIREALYPNQVNLEAADRINQTSITQPALFVVEYALARLWMEWGVRPRAMIGHSVGEYVAACLAGVFSLEDALSLVAARGRLMQGLPQGAMCAVALPEEELSPLLGETLSLAAVNTPALCVVSGPTDAVSRLRQQLDSRGAINHSLHVSHAFHSSMMKPILESFAREAQKVKRNPPRIPMISNLTGGWAAPGEITDPHYWTKHLLQTVRFADGVSTLFKERGWIWLEVGPGQVLKSLVERHADGSKQQIALSSMRRPDYRRSDVEVLLSALGKLWLHGFNLDWSKLYPNERRQRVRLPGYPFERKRFWVEPLREDRTEKQVESLRYPESFSIRKRDSASPTLPTAAPAESPSSEFDNYSDLELLVTQQMEIMSQQLNLLSDINAPAQIDSNSNNE